MSYATFTEAVPNARAIALALGQLMIDGDEACIDGDPADRIEEIEHESRDGFIPFTSGGFEVCLPAALAHHWGSGCAPAAVQHIIDRQEPSIADDWQRQHDDAPPFLECVNAEEGPAAAWRERAQEFEAEWWAEDTDCYYWKARVMFEDVDDHNGGSEPRVQIDAYLCLDSYGRDYISWLSCYGTNPNRTVGDFKAVIPLDKFVALQPSHINAIVKGATKRL
jgi:hypothetical protein